ETAKGRSTLLTTPPTTGERFIPIATETFPAGPFNLIMEYVAGGRTLFSESRRVVAGRVRLDFGRLDPTAQSVKGAVEIRTEGPVEGAHLTIAAERTRLDWDETARAYVEIPEGRE